MTVIILTSVTSHMVIVGISNYLHPLLSLYSLYLSQAPQLAVVLYLMG